MTPSKERSENSESFGLPSPREEELLKAALLQSTDAIEYWDDWIGKVDLEHDLTSGERRLLPLAYANLTTCAGVDTVSFHPKIIGLSKRTLYYNTILFNRLLAVINVLETIGVEPIVIKGAALVLSGVYPKAATRVMADYDLLVPFDRKRDVVRLLVDAGFQFLPRWNWYLEPFSQVHSISLTSENYGELDLHWFPLAVCKAEQANSLYFAHRQPTAIADREITIPVPELQWVHAVVHGLQHDSADRTQWVCDAVKLIERYPSINWEQVTHFAQTLHVGAFLQHATDYLARLFPETIEGNCLESIRRLKITETEKRVFTASVRPRERMREQFFLRKYDLQQQQPELSTLKCWFKIYRYWLHAASAASNGSVLREGFIAVGHLLSNKSYQMGEYRKK
ncbi:MAG: nucleotidyltransferase family protein [Planctomycetaceae bacterium]|nr:nucleotidyltransferase family protein [Planctomycetaceae bacterium]